MTDDARLKKERTAVLVNDDATQLTLFAGLLRKNGVSALSFESAESALSAMDPAAPPDIIVTDLYMPGIDGWRFCRLLRSPEYKAFNQVPILVVSATFSGDEAARITADLGANAFIPLPVHGKTFVAQATALMNRETPKNRLRALIADDSRSMAELLKETFENHGYLADAALSYQEAAAALDKAPYDVAVIDYHLPEKKGDGLIASYRAQRPDCVWIMITVDPRPELALECMKKGASDYLRKPFDPEYLVDVCVRSRRERSLLRVEQLLEQRTRELRDNEEWLRQVFNTSMDAIIIFDRDGKILSANPAARGMYEYEEGEMEGLSGADIVHPDCRHLFREFKTLAERGGRFQAESVDVRKDGTPFHIEVRGGVFQYKAKPHLLAVIRDITRRIKALEALQESEARYRCLTENFPNGALFLFDRDFRYLAANGKGFAAAGLSSDAVVGKTVREVFPGLWDAIRPHLEAVMQGAESYYEVEHNSRLYANQALPVVGQDGAVSQGIVITQDITDAKKAEEEKARLEAQFQQAQKLESVGRLAGGVAHDLNNLLAPILGYGEMILDDFDPSDARRASIEEILQAGMRARDLVRQLLAFSRKQMLEFTSVNLNGVLARFEKLLRRTIREDVALEIRPFPDLPPVRGDVGQLEQVIMNLAVNAQDAMPGGGRLCIETSAAGRDDGDQASAVLLTIRDTGEGMDEETRRRIFEPFFTTKAKDRGTGLGLATVYGIVKQHAGDIRVESEPGKGTTFIIRLPVSEAFTAKPRDPEAESGDPRGWETILLAEDNSQVKQLAYAILVRQGYTVLTAADGKDALRLIRDYDGPVHLLLTDVVMPEMSGKDLFSRLSGRFPEMKVIYMSGYTDDVIVHHGVLDKGLNFIHKPFSPRALALKVRSVLDNT